MDQNGFIGILERYKCIVEIETYGAVVRNDKGYSRERLKLLQDALYQKILIANNSLHSPKSFYMQIFLILLNLALVHYLFNKAAVETRKKKHAHFRFDKSLVQTWSGALSFFTSFST